MRPSQGQGAPGGAASEPRARPRRRVTGKSKKGEGATGYPHAEGELGASLVECGTKLDDTNIGKALVSAGDACKVAGRRDTRLRLRRPRR